MVKVAPESRKRATITETNTTTVACQSPRPSAARSRSPMRMPTVQPTATSATLRSFGSRWKPNAISRAVEAKSGWWWPSTVSANQ